MSPTLNAFLGPLASAVDDNVRDLCVTGDGRVWQSTGHGFVATDIIVDPREARRIGVGLVETAGGRVDDARPLGDAALAGEVRIHVALPPIARDGAILTLRFPRHNPVTAEDYVVGDDWDWGELVDQSILITGSTGSGKTTLIEFLMARAPTSDRIVVIEDIPEISPRHPHAVFLCTRAANAEGAGEITTSSLVRESLRMSPDRIVLGEVRGAEIVDLLVALTAGHLGLSSLHARSLVDVPERLTALGMVAGLAPDTVARLAAVAFDRVIHCERIATGSRLSSGTFRRVGDRLEVTR
jgi:pilus assembly protein CpaF